MKQLGDTLRVSRRDVAKRREEFNGFLLVKPEREVGNGIGHKALGLKTEPVALAVRTSSSSALGVPRRAKVLAEPDEKSLDLRIAATETEDLNKLEHDEP